MNELNYASLEASKKLVDNWIALETDFVWRLGADGWKLLNKDWVTNMMSNTYESYPAPCFTEVWRELPEQYDGEYLRVIKDDGKTFCDYGEYADRYCNINPTDALIDLLVWLKGQFESRSHD